MSLAVDTATVSRSCGAVSGILFDVDNPHGRCLRSDYVGYGTPPDTLLRDLAQAKVDLHP